MWQSNALTRSIVNGYLLTQEHIGVVTHGVFLDCLIDHVLVCPRSFKRGHFGNAECRAMQIDMKSLREVLDVRRFSAVGAKR